MAPPPIEIRVDPDHAIRLKTGRRYTMTVSRPLGLSIPLQLDPSAPDKGNDTISLQADDGSYARTLVVAEVCRPDPKLPGFVLVDFSDAPRSKALSCSVAPGPEEGPAYPLFSGLIPS